jgi:fructose/tagatose bisphosphate aldolase
LYFEGDEMNSILEKAVFAADEATRNENRQKIRQEAKQKGIFPASIHGLYEAAGKGEYSNRTVPAINLRGITYDLARSVFRAAQKNKVGVFVFEIARSEMEYTNQAPDEFVTSILAAALDEKHKGPVFVQGDHFQARRSKYLSDPALETKAIQNLIRDASSAGFLNIDIDASTLIDIDEADLVKQQDKNSDFTFQMTEFIRGIQPAGTEITIGGEIGEIGQRNSTVEDLRAFMKGYKDRLKKGLKGISKISVQTGTTHGGVVLPDGSIAKIKLDFKVLEDLGKVARDEYGLGGVVQHGASTLPEDAFELFPKTNVLEVHLATAFQNIIFDSRNFPADLLATINGGLQAKYASEKKAGETTEQFIYKTRKKAFGDYKKELWGLPDKALGAIGGELEERFSMIFKSLNVVNTVELVNKYISQPK